VDVADGAGRIGDELLANEHEGTIGHSPEGHSSFGLDDLRGSTAQVHRTGSTHLLVTPGNAIRNRKVELEHSRARPVVAQRRKGTSGHPFRENLRDVPWVEVEYGDVMAWQLPTEFDSYACLKSHPEFT
tara:strand:- start:58 stop:444 length:387 start_codon:yes stop_codon:yes gene_type:complete